MVINGVELNVQEQYILARWAYSIGESIMEDSQYNVLHKFMLKNNADSEYVKRTWSDDPCPVKLLKKVGKPDWIKKIVLGDKTESIPSVNTWSEFELSLHAISCPATLSMKLDGWNMQANYYNTQLINVQSRGRTSDFMEAPKLMPKVPQTIPAMGKVRIGLEATVSDANFAECVKRFGNVSQRSAVASVLAKTDDMRLIDLHAHSIYGVQYDADKKFDILESWGFKVPPNHKVYNCEELKLALKDLSGRKEAFGQPTDGAVYWGNTVYALRLLGWEEPLYMSFVTGYEEEFSAYRINPKVVIHPIYRNGGSQRLITITNWQRIINNDLRIGTPIAFKLVSESIADIDEDTTRRLHEEWQGHEDVFRQQVIADEERKRLQRNLI